ncbi:MAG: helix-turn-helix domain-containing protein [Planctomycetes bacterium]|nr:helix-turn-helix domain-containing protein [Planctomycetota bacterium]
MVKNLKEYPNHFAPGQTVSLMHHFRQDDLSAHSHEFTELVIINKGQAIHYVDKEEYVVSVGDVFVIDNSREHGYRDTKDFYLTNILFFPERVNLPSYDIGDLPGYHALFTLEPKYRSRHAFESRLRLSSQNMIKVSSMIDSLQEELERKSPGLMFMATAIFMQIVGFLSRCYSNTTKDSARQLLRIGEAISFLEKNYESQITLDDICHIAKMSKSSLLRSFKEALDRTPVEHLLFIRITKAAELLRRSNMQITEIAFSTGFTDSNYFSRQFRKITGKSPREYRKEK